MDHLTSNSLLNSHQSAHCKHHSTETALLYIHDHLISAIGSQKASRFAYSTSLLLLTLLTTTSWSPVSHAGLVSMDLFSAGSSHICHLIASVSNVTRSSAIAEGPCDVSCQLKPCQLPRNSAETTCTTSPEQIKVMKLEGYSGLMCNKHVHSTMMWSSLFHYLIGVINKPTTDQVVDITCIPKTCCGEIF